MGLDFLKGKYGFQLITFLFLTLISYLLTQLISLGLILSFSSLSLSDFQDPNFIELIMNNPQGYSILFLLLSLQSFGLFILPSLVFPYLMPNRICDYLSFRWRASLKFILYLPLFALAGVFIVGFLGELNMKLNLPAVFHKMEENAAQTIQYILSYTDTRHIILSVILMSVLPAIGEELFFRGIIQKILIQWTKKNWLGIVITAFVFSAVHFQFLTFLPRFFMGLMLGYLFVWSKNLLIPILAHFLHNLISIGIGYVYPQSQTEEISSVNGWIILISIGVMFFVGYYYFLNSKKHVS